MKKTTVTVRAKAKAYVAPEPGMRPRVIEPGTTVVLEVEETDKGPKLPRWAELKKPKRQVEDDEPKKRGPGRPPKQREDEPKAEE